MNEVVHIGVLLAERSKPKASFLPAHFTPEEK
jgi:hypothetical protein